VQSIILDQAPNRLSLFLDFFVKSFFRLGRTFGRPSLQHFLSDSFGIEYFASGSHSIVVDIVFTMVLEIPEPGLH
jgi:hypothetical protein